MGGRSPRGVTRPTTAGMRADCLVLTGVSGWRYYANLYVFMFLSIRSRPPLQAVPRLGIGAGPTVQRGKQTGARPRLRIGAGCARHYGGPLDRLRGNKGGGRLQKSGCDPGTKWSLLENSIFAKQTQMFQIETANGCDWSTGACVFVMAKISVGLFCFWGAYLR
jgi:hypothetical protein